QPEARCPGGLAGPRGQPVPGGAGALPVPVGGGAGAGAQVGPLGQHPDRPAQGGAGAAGAVPQPLRLALGQGPVHDRPRRRTAALTVSRSSRTLRPARSGVGGTARRTWPRPASASTPASASSTTPTI